MKKLFIFLFSLTLFCTKTWAYTIIEDQSHLDIKNPLLAERKVRKLKLDNGLEALLISDPGTSESGAAMAVGVGSWDDPKDRPGMAHFVEHLLFLGTEKYPEEEGYTRFLDEKGGSRNAFTMADRTVYMFSVNNDGFSEALDRFGQFFIAPLFNPSGVGRESKAIHQEFCKDKPIDAWRMLYVKKELANTSHPFHSFCIGNEDTLAKISQDELKEWYRTHYSANLMHLVVYSYLDLETLEKEVSSLFGKVENKKKESSHFSHNLFSGEQMAKMIAISPVQDLQVLELAWELPRIYGKDKEMHVDKLVSRVLGHEGEISLLSELKRENLAEAISAGNYRAGSDQFLFAITIELTSKGVQEYERVIERTFQAISSLKQMGIPKYIFDEVKNVEEMQYRFQGRQDVYQLVMEYATNLIDEPLATFPRKTLIPSVYSPEKIHSLIECLTPATCHYTLVAKPSVCHLTHDTKEKWMGVEYSVLPIASEKIALWSLAEPHRKISIPRPNPFIPNNLIVSEPSFPLTLVPKPKIIEDSPKGKFYYCPDTQFSEPEVSLTFRIKTPEISDEEPKSRVQADLFCLAVKDKLNSLSYEARLAGLAYSIKPRHNWLDLKVYGYSDKAASYLTSVVHGIKNTMPTETEFAFYKEQLQREYQNQANETPLKRGTESLLKILYKQYSTLDEKTKAIKALSYKEMQPFCKKVFQKTYVEGMLYGNLNESEAKEISSIVAKSLDSSPYLISSHPKIELALFPEKEPTFLSVKTDLSANALILTADCGEFSFEKRAAQEILVKGLEEPFFSELRTKQQTAYVVTNWSQELERHLYCFFAIQSSSHDARDLLARFELFFESTLQNLKESVITEERFESIRDSLVEKLLNPAENLQKMGSLLHSLAFDYDGDFSWVAKRIESYKNLTYPKFLEYATQFLGKENPKRLALCISGNLEGKGKCQYREIKDIEKIRKEISYKARTRNE